MREDLARVREPPQDLDRRARDPRLVVELVLVHSLGHERERGGARGHATRRRPA